MNSFLDKRLFGSLAPDLARDGNSEVPLREAMNALEAPGFIPKQAGLALQHLLTPEVEKPNVNGDRQPRVFGVPYVLPMLGDLLKGEPVEMNLGMSAAVEVNPSLPAYVELGLQRLKPLLALGCKVRLRVFSTGSLSPLVNGADAAQIQDVQAQQKAMLDAYLARFYPELRPHVDLEDLEQKIDPYEPDVLEGHLQRIDERVHPKWQEVLRSFGVNHGGEQGARHAMVYAAYHAHPQVFRDNAEADRLLSVGGVSESAFNEVRFGAFARENHKNVGVVVAPGILSNTPPYLAVPNAVTMSEWTEPSGRVGAFLSQPKANRHLVELPGSRDLLHIARCLKGRSQLAEGLEVYRDFCIDNSLSS